MADLDIVGGSVWLDGDVHPADVTIRDGRVVDIVSRAEPRNESAETVIDAGGLYVAPGYIDLQCNGALGVDLSTEPERLWEVAAGLPRWGVTTWLPTIISSPAEIRLRAMSALAGGSAVSPGEAVARPLGLHFEGPFIAAERAGAHPPEHLLAPDMALVEAEGWSAARGVALVTLAPELPGAGHLISALVAVGVTVSAGHSSADVDEAAAAVDAGAHSVTHLFNAMAPMHHRRPGLAGLALSDERVHVGLIADGLHVHPAAVSLAARAAGDRLCLVSDAVAALGDSPGPLLLGASEAVAGDDGVRLADGTLAGSMLSMDRAVRNLVAFAGIPLGHAVRAATAAPAAVLGLGDRGVIAPGAVGDAVLLDSDGCVVATVVAGELAHLDEGHAWRS